MLYVMSACRQLGVAIHLFKNLFLLRFWCVVFFVCLCIVGFFLACEEFWENVRSSIPRLRFFFKVGISTRTLIPLFRPGSFHSG